MMKLYHEDATSLSFEGETYERGKEGHFEVPDHAHEHLEAHGFKTEPIKAKKAEK